MRNFKLTIRRSVTMVTHIDMVGDSEADAIARFQHQLESESCGAVDDQNMWAETFYYQIAKASPYSGEYAVMDVELND